MGCRQAIPGNYIDIPEGGLGDFLKYDKERIPLVSAHRGGIVYEGYPENAIETFDFVVTQVPALIECDVRITSDSVLILLHDDSLERTTTGSGKVNQKTWEEISKLFLVDNFGNETNFHIPKLEDALNWGRGKTIFTLDVKQGVQYEMVLDVIRKCRAEDYIVFIVYTSEDALNVYKANQRIMISAPMRNDEEVEWMLETGIPSDRLIAFAGTTESAVPLYEKIHSIGIQTILGVFGNIDNKAKARGDEVYIKCINNGADILSTDRPVEAAKAIGQIIPLQSPRLRNFK